MNDSDLFDDLCARLFRLREMFGSDIFKEAVFRSAVAIARVALAEAEGRAARRSPVSGAVLHFPASDRSFSGPNAAEGGESFERKPEENDDAD